MAEKTVQTLADIARLANVSTSTVSRALNDSPLLNPETKERIQAIAREQHFRVNIPARNLRLRQSRTIAYISPACIPEYYCAEDLFGMAMMSSIEEGLRGLRYDLLIAFVEARGAAWARDYLDSGRADGFILSHFSLKPAEFKKLVEAGVPFITWGAPVLQLNYCSVTGDNLNGGLLATQYLIRAGRQRIAFLGGPTLDSQTVQNRFQGYENALQAAGRAVDPRRVIYGDYSYESGVTGMRQLLEQSPDLDAVFAVSDLMAIGAIRAAQESGRRVPEDIGVVGYDDLSIAMYNNLPLTTIRQNIPLAGRLLAQNLIQHIQTGIVTNVITPVELVVRKSA
jgi:DNA-binding LacI/PurR family transcriptional regulator